MFNFRVENMRSQSNVVHYMRLQKNIPEKDYYYFFDYHNLNEYKQKKKKYDTISSFFFPDFITENFSSAEFYNSLIDWLDFINLKLSNDNDSEIIRLLEEEKEKSIVIIERIENKDDISRIKANGYEKVTINFLNKNYGKEIQRAYPNDIHLNPNNEIKKKDTFKQIFKREITSRIKDIVKNSMKNDPKRRDFKFPFEIKLEPFYRKIADLYNRVPSIN